MRASRFHARLPAAALLALVLATALGAPACPAAAGDGDGERDAPRLARLVRLGGTVVVEALVDSSGRVRATNVVRSQPLLDDSASVEVARRRFVPERSADGRALPSVRTVPVTFAAPSTADPRWPGFVASRCEPIFFLPDPDFRPDSAGTLAIRWAARGPRSHELRLLVLVPDGVEVDTTGQGPPQRLLDTLDPAIPGWPTWIRSGRELREDGAAGTVLLRLGTLPPWWSSGRIALVALFHDVVDRAWVVRQAVYRIERDAAGPFLVRDASVDECLAGPFRPH